MRSMVEGFWMIEPKNPSTACGGPPPPELWGRKIK
jgi:hypothetical protein